MTETTTTPAAENAGGMLCRSGSKTDRPCWREATEKAWDETEPTRCPEHQRVVDLAMKMDGWLHALESVRGFLESEAVKEDPFGLLENLAQTWRDQIIEGAAKDAHKLQVAEFLADQGPDNKGPESGVMRELGAHLLTRSDALSNAYAVLIGGRETTEEERLIIIAAVAEAQAKASEEWEKFRVEYALDR